MQTTDLVNKMSTSVYVVNIAANKANVKIKFDDLLRLVEARKLSNVTN